MLSCSHPYLTIGESKRLCCWILGFRLTATCNLKHFKVTPLKMFYLTQTSFGVSSSVWCVLCIENCRFKFSLFKEDIFQKCFCLNKEGHTGLEQHFLNEFLIPYDLTVYYINFLKLKFSSSINFENWKSNLISDSECSFYMNPQLSNQIQFIIYMCIYLLDYFKSFQYDRNLIQAELRLISWGVYIKVFSIQLSHQSNF